MEAISSSNLFFTIAFPGCCDTRNGWPASEQDVNLDNYKAAIGIFGPDDINTYMWCLQ
jgi:hypothetical protein